MRQVPERRLPSRSPHKDRDWLAALLRHSPVPALGVTPEGKIVGVNAAFSRLLAYKRQDLIGCLIREICVQPREWEVIESTIKKSGNVRDLHLHLRHNHGTQTECVVAAKTMGRSGDNVYCCFLWDFTSCAEKMGELERAGRRHRLFASLEKDSLWTSEFDSNRNIRVTYMSEPIANIMGYTAEEVTTMTLDQLVMPSSAKGAGESYVRQLRIDGKKGVDSSRSWNLELELRHKNGHPIWVETRSTFMRDEWGKPIGIIGFTRDITERRRYEAQLKALSSRLVELQETERRHIARELHDQIGQSLTGVRMLLGMLPVRRSTNSGKRISEVQGLIDDMMNRVKDLSLELRPSTLDDLGLLPTLLRHFATYKTQTNITVRFKQRGLGRRFSQQIETAVFRIVQEGLTNVARHAKVTEVEVRIIVTRGKLRIQIDDGGKGFAPKAVFASGTASGIAGMQERAALLGGLLSVESVPGVGTRLAADIPLKTSPEARAEK
jgi:PAS domain S-box-containing protein